MSDTRQLRAGVTGLVAFAGVEEETLLASAGTEPEAGSPERWAALPLVAHNTEFKRQQVQRLEAVRRAESPPGFAEIDHSSGELYRRLAELPGEVVAQDCHLTTRALIEEMWAVSDEDLCDPSPNAFLAGRQLWLQVVVRGFWHPSGHLGEYYLAHGRFEDAIGLQSRAVVTGALLSVPDPAQAMAFYNLACAQARAGEPAAGLKSLQEAIGLNPPVAGERGARRGPGPGPRRRPAGVLARLGLKGSSISKPGTTSRARPAARAPGLDHPRNRVRPTAAQVGALAAGGSSSSRRWARTTSRAGAPSRAPDPGVLRLHGERNGAKGA
jgi:hypothetical protein